MSEMDDIEIQRDPPIPEEPEFSCASCRYWTDETGLYDEDDENNGLYGLCRRYAPRAKSIVTDGSIVKHTPRAVWPLTHYDECCGEWKE